MQVDFYCPLNQYVCHVPLWHRMTKHSLDNFKILQELPRPTCGVEFIWHGPSATLQHHQPQGISVILNCHLPIELSFVGIPTALLHLGNWKPEPWSSYALSNGILSMDFKQHITRAKVYLVVGCNHHGSCGRYWSFMSLETTTYRLGPSHHCGR
jgi:hypothetical protein